MKETDDKEYGLEKNYKPENTEKFGRGQERYKAQDRPQRYRETIDNLPKNKTPIREATVTSAQEVKKEKTNNDGNYGRTEDTDNVTYRNENRVGRPGFVQKARPQIFTAETERKSTFLLILLLKH